MTTSRTGRVPVSRLAMGVLLLVSGCSLSPRNGQIIERRSDRTDQCIVDRFLNASAGAVLRDCRNATARYATVFARQ